DNAAKGLQGGSYGQYNQQRRVDTPLHTQEVTGSSPVAPTIQPITCCRSDDGIPATRVRNGWAVGWADCPVCHHEVATGALYFCCGLGFGTFSGAAVGSKRPNELTVIGYLPTRLSPGPDRSGSARPGCRTDSTRACGQRCAQPPRNGEGAK